MRRVLPALLALLLIGGALTSGVAYGKAKKKKAKPCATFTPVEPDTDNEAGEATEAPVTPVTEAATEDAPVTVESEVGPGIQLITDLPSDATNSTFANFQIDSKAEYVILNVRIEWPGPSPSDIDLYLFDSSGAMFDSSVAYNPFAGSPADSQSGSDNDGNGWEQSLPLPIQRCEGFTAQARVSSSMGEPITFKVWVEPAPS